MKTQALIAAAALALSPWHIATGNPYQQAFAELEAHATQFITAPGYTPVDPDTLTGDAYYSSRHFPASGDGSQWVRLPDADLDPLTRSVLLLDAAEAPLPHVRYHVTYSMNASTEVPEAQQDYIEVTRYNIGPSRRDDLRAYVSEDQLADAEEFGIGPHVSWRFVMAPVVGSQAGLIHASRKEVPDAQAQTADCLGEPCLSLADPSGPAGDWQPVPAPQLEPAAYAATSELGIATPTRVVHELWATHTAHGMDPLPYSPGQPHFVVVVSINTGGQEAAASGLLQQTLVLDHAVSEIWLQRQETADLPAEFSGRLVPRR